MGKNVHQLRMLKGLLYHRVTDCKFIPLKISKSTIRVFQFSLLHIGTRRAEQGKDIKFSSITT